MRASRVLLNASKKGGFNIPLELTPLFVAMGVAVASAGFFTYKKLAYDGSLRLTRNPRQQSDDLSQYLKKDEEVKKSD
ncbi:hypothetical protein WICANDRAFT_65804 [Wickerhamomyces anomalus NRRL Y-366-8]|uniref:Uncharacterized protein n=1 Tax=Wickerhamomyces anomalus (strain ATCC 58044 / CBS 1984 / NCYC 433 / NRRL Y-366-8) TaxID=683960 RepID=A0A1E3NV13_WICAA|nr:uncharacterized protein WICANDRAFT_65804 [Wickerhamomyces anomalus NRRL Y-366-8]ODQ56924.1 hypothetical protein WICANDRAFT_65804 [Wickerhamomyces anomalus NRRL Y-366-8]